jgi:Bacterial Ig domain
MYSKQILGFSRKASPTSFTPFCLALFLLFSAFLLNVNPTTFAINNNQAPIAIDDHYMMVKDTTINLYPLKFDFDPDPTQGVSLKSLNGININPTAAQIISVLNGQINVSAKSNRYPSRTISFTPNPGFVGDVTILYRIIDGFGGSANARQIIKVRGCLTEVAGGINATFAYSSRQAEENFDNSVFVDKTLTVLPYNSTLFSPYSSTTSVYSFGNNISKAGRPTVTANTNLNPYPSAPVVDNIYYYQETVNGKNLEYYILLDRSQAWEGYAFTAHAYVDGVAMPIDSNYSGGSSVGYTFFYPVKVLNDNCII